MLKRVTIRSYEYGLYFRRGEFQRLLTPGKYWFVDLGRNVQVDIVSQRDPWLQHEKLDVIVKSGVLEEHAEVLDLKDHQRALVWIDGRFQQILSSGLYAYWKGFKDVKVEIVDGTQARFQHAKLKTILRSANVSQVLDLCTIERNHVGVFFQDGDYVETLSPGPYAFWKQIADSKVVEVDTREQTLDIGGQDIMTKDKVTLRVNALVTYRISDAHQAVTTVDGATQALYRETQLALRAVVGTRDLDEFLVAKDAIVSEIEEHIRRRAQEWGLVVASVGIRDVILPGDMKDLMNKVTEAKKEAEARLITRREETAAMRSQANTAKLLSDNPTLMRLRELEVLEKVAASGNLNVVLGEKGLADRIVNLL